jgi:hypothetical protein
MRWSRARTGCAAAVRMHALRVARACEGGFGMRGKNGSRLDDHGLISMHDQCPPSERAEGE